MIASATPEDYGRAIGTVADDLNVDAMIAIYIPPLESDAPAVATAMVEAITRIDGRIPVLTCFMSSRGLPDALRAPAYASPRSHTRNRPRSPSRTRPSSGVASEARGHRADVRCP